LFFEHKSSPEKNTLAKKKNGKPLKKVQVVQEANIDKNRGRKTCVRANACGKNNTTFIKAIREEERDKNKQGSRRGLPQQQKIATKKGN